MAQWVNKLRSCTRTANLTMLLVLNLFFVVTLNLTAATVLVVLGADNGFFFRNGEVQPLRLVTAPHRVGVVVQLDLTDGNFMLVHNAGAAQKCAYAQHKFLPVRRFCHIIIRTYDKSRVLILRHILSRQH